MLNRIVLIINFFIVFGISAQDSFFLVDTSNFYQLTDFERELLKEYLPSMDTIKSDTQKIVYLNGMYEQMNDNDVWVEYLKLMYHKVLKLEDKPEYSDFVSRFKWIYFNDYGFYKNYKREDSGALESYKSALEIAESNNNLRWKAITLTNISNVYSSMGDNITELAYLDSCLEIYKKLNDTLGIATQFNDIASLYSLVGNTEKAIQFHFEGLKLREAISDSMGVATSLNNIGTLYNIQGDLDMAIEYFQKSREILLKLDNKKALGTLLNNIGLMLNQKGLCEKSLDYFKEGYDINVELKNPIGVAYSLLNIGIALKGMNRPDTAIACMLASAEIREKYGLTGQLPNSYSNISLMYLYLQNLNKAEEYGQKAMKIAKEYNSASDIKLASYVLANVYKKKGDWRNAYENYELHIQMRDSINNVETQKEALRQQMNYEYGRHIMQMELEQEKKDALALRQKEKQQFILIGVSSGTLLLIVFSIFIFNRFRITRKQKRIIEEQKHEVEEKNREITDSISYALRIQEAILPPDKLVKSYLKESFILYKPKDIVAGDFYWMEVFGNQIIFAAADCTGHGVPGAMVSVVCHSALQRTVKEFGIYQPAEILDKVSELVEETFAKSENEIKDGMDIALCNLNSETFELQFAGANNGLWIIHPDKANIQSNLFEALEEIKADRQPIGKYIEKKPFTNHTIKLKENDCIYIFSDGYADQFGGPNGKKFKYKALKTLLVDNHSLPMSEQREILDTTIEEWRSDIEQIDDILIIGVKVSNTQT